jgi:hypothetical protein
MGEDLAPVGDVAEGRERVAPDPGQLVGRGEHGAIDRDADHEHGERREESPRPSGPEAAEADASVAAGFRQ